MLRLDTAMPQSVGGATRSVVKKKTAGATARRSHAERTDLSDHRMFDAAKALILEVGTQQTTLKEVGERAGYSRGLANARFGSKDGLFIKLADRYRTLWLEQLEQAAEGKSGLDLLVSRLDAIAAFADRRPDEARVMYILWFESVGAPSQMNANLARFHAQARADIKQLAMQSQLFKGRNAEARAERYAAQFCGTIFGICYQWIVDSDAIDVRKTVSDMKKDLTERASR
ncbi:MAG: helix-turn-helix domain-containing protein [Pseudomonadota bacterium]